MPLTRLFGSIFLVVIGSSLSLGDDLVVIQGVSSKRDYRVAKAAEDHRIYTDRDYVIQELPDGLLGFPLIRTSNEDDQVDAAEHLKLQLKQQATIYVCWDHRAYRPAHWLKGWRRVKGTLEGEDTDFNLYRKVFSTGEVTLGGNMRDYSGAASNYFVIVVPGSESHGLEDAHTVDDLILSVTRPQPATADSGGAVAIVSRRSPPTRAPQVPAGFAVKLFAHEPMIHNPCAMAFDADGRMCVAFGPQYRKPRPNTPGDKVAILIDENDDGVADRRQIFAEGFNCIQGIVWNGDQLWVANAPDLTVVRDLDGDDRADEYVRVYCDLGNLEHALHGLNWAPDGKLYMSKGNSKGHNRPAEDGRVAPRAFRELFGLAHPEGAPDLPPPVKFTPDTYYSKGRGYHDPSDDWGREGGVLRCGPMGRDPEIVSRGFRNPWGIAFDEQFSWLGTDNDQDQGDKIFTPFFGAHFGWGHPWSYNWNDSNHLPTVPASAPLYEGSGTGIMYYSGTQFPPEFRNVFLINDWLRNATYLYRSRWDGALRQPQHDQLEFIALQDAGGMYKPTDLKAGPDGAVYIASWGIEYGAEWKPGEENRTQINEGRIYKMWFAGNPLPRRNDWFHPKREQPVTNWSVEQLTGDLGPNALPIWRVNAQNELVRRGLGVRKQLIELLKAGELTTMQQTWAIWALGRASRDDRETDDWLSHVALGDDNETLQIQALRILAFRIRETGSTRALPPSVATALRDSKARIRFEAVHAIWQANDRTKLDALTERAADETDQLTYYSAWNALRDLATVPERRALLDDQRPGVRLAALLGLMDDFELTKEEVLRRIEADSDSRFQQWGLKWVLAGQPPRTVSNQKERVAAKDNLNADDVISRLETVEDDRIRAVLLKMLADFRIRGDQWTRVKRIYDARMSASPSPGEQDVAAMLTVLSEERRGYPVLWEALDKNSEVVQSAAAEGLAREEEGRAYLLERLASDANAGRYRLAVQSLAKWLPDNASLTLKDTAATAIESLYASNNDDAQFKSQVVMLLTSADGKLFSEGTRTRLLRLAQTAADDPDPRVYGGAARLAESLGGSVSVPEREPATVEDVLPLLAQANPERGETTFFDRQRANCLTCHRVGNRGTDFAPALSDIGRRLKSHEILESILFPSRKITEGFAVTNLIMNDGRVLSGVVKSESASTIQLFMSDGHQLEVPKKEIDERELSKTSVMPANFGLLLTKHELADVVAWLMTHQAQSVLSRSPSATPNANDRKPDSTIEFFSQPGSVAITANGHPLATYYYADEKITRPYLAHVHAPGGIQVTRNHPPQPGDPGDHAELHPGIFLAFGDISGHDYWRLAARVVHDGFQQTPQTNGNRGHFIVKNRYLSSDGTKTVCVELCKLRFTAEADAYRIDWESRFSSPDSDFYFGDQEEMGLGVRVASAIREKSGGGRLLNSEGLISAKRTWGQPAKWCDYAGTIGGEHVGVTIMAAPYNARPSWWHNRDYGVFVANMFGREAMKQGPPSQLVVRQGEVFRMGYGIRLHASGNSEPTQAVMQQHYLHFLKSLE